MKPHEEWLYKAGHDLESAKILMDAPGPLYDIAIYHTQQCAEKSLEAFLSFSEKEIEKIHNLTVLLGLCAEIDNDFNSLRDDAIFLNPYSTLYRYPEGDLMPSVQDLQKALSASYRILSFVKNKL